ncbi:unnamed protein product [Symbiodinium microadriaticum]|nr:unnamed protein product [Symbiodinium microadriaticum]
MSWLKDRAAWVEAMQLKEQVVASTVAGHAGTAEQRAQLLRSEVVLLSDDSDVSDNEATATCCVPELFRCLPFDENTSLIPWLWPQSGDGPEEGTRVPKLQAGLVLAVEVLVGLVTVSAPYRSTPPRNPSMRCPEFEEDDDDSVASFSWEATVGHAGMHEQGAGQNLRSLPQGRCGAGRRGELCDQCAQSTPPRNPSMRCPDFEEDGDDSVASGEAGLREQSLLPPIPSRSVARCQLADDGPASEVAGHAGTAEQRAQLLRSEVVLFPAQIPCPDLMQVVLLSDDGDISDNEVVCLSDESHFSDSEGVLIDFSYDAVLRRMVRQFRRQGSGGVSVETLGLKPEFDDGTRRWKKFADEAAAESWLRQNLLVELPAPDEDRPSSNTRGVKWCSERGLWKVQVLDPKTGKRKYGGRFANLKTAERKAEEMRVQFSQQEASGAKAKRDPGRAQEGRGDVDGQAKRRPGHASDWAAQPHEQGPRRLVQALLSALADVFLVRRAADKHDGEGLQQPHVQKGAQRHLSIVFGLFGVGTQELLQRVQGHPCLSVEELVRAVQIGWETTDATTRLHDRIMKRASSKNSSLWAYFLSRFSGRVLAEKIAASGSKLQGSTMTELAEWACQLVQNKRDLFSRSFRPQSIHGRMCQGMSREAFLSRDFLRKRLLLSLHPGRVTLKNSDGSWRRKRAIMQDLKKLRGANNFIARNHYRVLTNHAKGCLSHNTYTECGPGARRLLNLLHGYPVHWCVTARSQETADAYSKMALEVQRDFRNLLQARKRKADTDAGKQPILRLIAGLADLDCFEFFLCEGWRVVAYLHSRDPQYLRGQAVALQEDAEVVEASGASCPHTLAMTMFQGLMSSGANALPDADRDTEQVQQLRHGDPEAAQLSAHAGQSDPKEIPEAATLAAAAATEAGLFQRPSESLPQGIVPSLDADSRQTELAGTQGHGANMQDMDSGASNRDVADDYGESLAAAMEVWADAVTKPYRWLEACDVYLNACVKGISLFVVVHKEGELKAVASSAYFGSFSEADAAMQPTEPPDTAQPCRVAILCRADLRCTPKVTDKNHWMPGWRAEDLDNPEQQHQRILEREAQARLCLQLACSVLFND